MNDNDNAENRDTDTPVVEPDTERLAADPDIETGPDTDLTAAYPATDGGPTSSQPLSSPEPNRGTHPVNVLHLVMGVVFLGLVTIWALFESDIASTDDLRWLIPLPWVIAGAAGLIVLTMSGRRRAH
jgi:hypothetical protein